MSFFPVWGTFHCFFFVGLGNDACFVGLLKVAGKTKQTKIPSPQEFEREN